MYLAMKQTKMKYSWKFLLIILGFNLSTFINGSLGTPEEMFSSVAHYRTKENIVEYTGQTSVSSHHRRHNHSLHHQRIRRHQQQHQNESKQYNDFDLDNTLASDKDYTNDGVNFPLINTTHESSLESLPDEFWIHVAQAKAMALYIENETLPRLDEWSQIMKAASCREDKDNSKCKDFLTCAIDVATFLRKNPLEVNAGKSYKDKVISYMERIWSDCNVPLTDTLIKATEQGVEFAPLDVPHPVSLFHCNTHVGNMDFNRNFQSNFRMEYPGTISPPNYLSSEMIPRFFVIEKQQLGKWNFHGVTPYWLFRFDIKLNETFRLRITPVSPRYVYRPVMSHPVTLYESSIQTIGAPVNLRVVNITVDDGAARPSPSALLRWNSGSGYNASCDFDVFYMDDDLVKLERKKGDHAFWVKLEKLRFEGTYNIKVIEKFGGNREAKAVMDLQIPPCLQLRGYNFDFCAPPPPTNVQLVNATETSFWIVWDPPKYTNSTNKIKTYNISVDWSNASPVSDSILHPSTVIHKVFNGNVAGNITRLQIKNGTIQPGQYRVSVIAVSGAGPSIAGLNDFNYKGIDTGIPPHSRPTTPPQHTWTVQTIVTLVLVLLGVILLIGLACLFKNFYERRQRKKKRQEKFDNYEKESFQLPQIDRDASKWEIDSCSIALGEPIGQGHFGLVRKALLNRKGRKIVVAVKTLRDDVAAKDVEKFWEEFEILKNLDPHVHLVGLKGIVTKHVPLPLLVVEYCDGGDLQSHLRKAFQSNGFARKYSPGSTVNSGSSTISNSENRVQVRIVTNEAYFIKNEPRVPQLTMADLLSYSRQIACGMEYLSANKIVHRDLAARNILISGKLRILKISDFGLSRDVYEQSMYKKSSSGDIPIKWLAIESLLKEIYTTESDVWSYGILLWEIFTYGGIPYPGVDNSTVFDLIKNGYRMPKPEHCPEDLYDLMRCCWADEPRERPDFTAIRLILEDIIEKTTQVTYLNLESGIGSSCDETYGTKEPTLPPRRKPLPPTPLERSAEKFNTLY